MKKGYEMQQGYTVEVMGLKEEMAKHTPIATCTACIAEGGGILARWSVYDTRTIAPALSTFRHVGHVLESVSYRN